MLKFNKISSCEIRLNQEVPGKMSLVSIFEAQSFTKLYYELIHIFFFHFCINLLITHSHYTL